MPVMTEQSQVRARDIGAPVAAGHSSTEFASQHRPDSAAVLTLPGNTPWGDSGSEPSADQLHRARAAAERHLAFVNGATTIDVEQLTRQKATIIAEQEGAYTAWKAGESHPDDSLYADVWEGLAPGVSREDAEKKLASAHATRNGQHGAPLLGQPAGYRSSPLAQEHLNERIALYEEALRCDGRNLSVNQANVRQNKRATDQIPF